MYTFDIQLDLSEAAYDGYVDEECKMILGYLEETSQILSSSFQCTQEGNIARIPVVCPAMDSLDEKYRMPVCSSIITRLEAHLKRTITFVHTGTEVRAADYEVPEKSSWFILKYREFSPLKCGDTYEPIPLYRIPFTTDYQSYQNVTLWLSNYESIYTLWSIGTIGEQSTLRQMQDAESTLSKEGREVCRRIEASTGVPTYYFLMNWRAWGRKKDEARKCPGCGGDWLIPEATFNDYIAFKCDNCRLVSELSSNC
ncbi:Zn-ribbon-containing protein [Nibrella saemangeumensis]|uniref:Zn-ribbon-containing protein n=1 Tax=Nibrella saemangeumensis TaxID=1084526 RepID=A0ABP8NRU3_9BACT